MRVPVLLPLLLLAACSKGGSGSAGGGGGLAGTDSPVPCALAGARDFAPDCRQEVTKRDGEEIWVVRHPDGGFRRFVIIDNGTRIATADGVEEVEAKRVGSELEVRVGNDRYRFPAAPETPEPSASAS